jgi:uncharacterized membrane protein
MNEQEIMSELISGGLRCHCALVAIMQAIAGIIILIFSIVIGLFDIIIGFLIIFKGFLLIARFLLEQSLKKEKERRAFI